MPLDTTMTKPKSHEAYQRAYDAGQDFSQRLLLKVVDIVHVLGTASHQLHLQLAEPTLPQGPCHGPHTEGITHTCLK